MSTRGGTWASRDSPPSSTLSPCAVDNMIPPLHSDHDPGLKIKSIKQLSVAAEETRKEAVLQVLAHESFSNVTSEVHHESTLDPIRLDLWFTYNGEA